jgi:hypothetical protein
MASLARCCGAGLAALGASTVGLAFAAPPPLTQAPIALARPATSVAPSLDGSSPVTITLNATLAGLHPDAVSGAWLCSARAMSKPAIDAEIGKINALSGQAASMEFGSALESRAHYLGQQTTVPFAVAAGGTGTSQSISIKVGRDDLVDPTTQRLVDQPAVMVGCWLRLANAAGQSVVAYQAARPAPNSSPLTVMAQLTSRPYFLASASVPND